MATSCVRSLSAGYKSSDVDLIARIEVAHKEGDKGQYMTVKDHQVRSPLLCCVEFKV